MVATRNNDLYSPFPTPFAIEDGAQSSEDGSGLHSPTFPDKETSLDAHRADFRLPPSDIDVNILAQQLSATPHAFSTPPYHHNIPEVTSNYSYPHSHRDYDEENDQYYNTRPSRGGYTMQPSIRHVAEPAMDALRPLALPSLPVGISDSRVYLSTAGEPTRMDEDTTGDGYDSGGSPTSPNDGSSNGQASARPADSPTQNRSTPSRREASMVVIACRQCRARKIRCDSTRPSCNNCLRRSNECQYDAVPKRRGPDKRPGTRQRSCKKRPADGSLPQKKKQKRTDDRGRDQVNLSGVAARENMSLRLDMSFTARNDHPANGVYTTPIDDGPPFQYPTTASPATTMSLHAPVPRSATSPELPISKVSAQRGGPFSLYEDLSAVSLSSPTDRKPFLRSIDLNSHRPDERLVQAPLSDINRKMWWDDLLNEYSHTRDQSTKDIEEDLSFLFRTSNYWLSFVNEKLFFRTLWDDTEREKIQPSLVLSALALATLMKSSEIGFGEPGRKRALYLRNTAQASLEAAWNAHRVDTTLAEAAMILALFESSAHPEHTADRACNSLVFLDEIIHALALTTMDAGDPDVTVFVSNAAPIVPRTHSTDITAHKRCYCAPAAHSSTLMRDPLSATWTSSPGWDVGMTVPEIRREEIRRLCWSALALAAAHTAHCAAFNREPLDLFLIQPENYALLFPGEKSRAGDRNTPQSPKQSVWALYCRSMLLWNSCLRLRKGSASDGEKAEFAMQAWLETQEIQDTVDAHICAIDTHLLYMTREYLFNTRVAITYEFRRFVPSSNIGASPVFNRRQAEEWVYYQNQTAKRFHTELHSSRDPQAHVLARRPFYVWWFMSQVAISMSLWAYDRSLVQALELCKAFLVPLDILSALWPCPAQRARYDELREELAENCNKAGLPPPPPANYSIPMSLRM
ncbi:hypothetical protein BD410DRAFT_786409 [Rickenella mellea]|uniref:Zn(2)-C6 fungal-type domain-containing protein n=1 Tax=Rickenella mellea TaxID=50990 RepID=A0A4Y7QAN6_9AGAM|nr:hypothetical protein BD410DRAFT_786409 [Rickenella mellea]